MTTRMHLHACHDTACMPPWTAETAPGAPADTLRARQTIREALIGPHADLYATSVGFKNAVDTLADSLPAIGEGHAATARAGETTRRHFERLVATMPPPKSTPERIQ
ncbi:MAG: hypothetical protein HOV66_12190 [Streptomycetaceae bacterium]|nr:hypothetical protein [Streptomycetaceae bacterium]